MVTTVAMPSDFYCNPMIFLQGMCSKLGCVVSNFSARFFQKTIDYMTRVEDFQLQNKQNFLISISYCFYFCAVY